MSSIHIKVNMINDILSKLDKFKDPKFKFDPSHHKYTYNGNPYTSVTQLLKNFYREFDENFWSQKKSEERGITKEEILNEWKIKNEYANFVGSQTHAWIENYFNKIYQPIPNNLDLVDRINKFNLIYAKDLFKLTPIQFEVKIFSKIYSIAGTIDSLFLFKDKIIMIDYKTNGKFTHDDHPDGKYEYLLNPFSDIFKNHLNEYSIQLSLYSLILKECGIDIAACYLLHIGPESDPKIYKAHNFLDRIKTYLDVNYTIPKENIS